MSLIFKALRKKQGMNQGPLANKAGLYQAVVSAIETLPPAEKARKISRTDLIKAVKALNLKKPGMSINALVYLFDGQGLTSKERKEFELKRSVPMEEQSKLSATILELLNQATSYYKDKEAQCLSIMSETEEEELDIYQKFLKIEQEPGLRILMKRIPSSLTYPPTIHRAERGIPKKISSLKGIKRFCEIREKRIQNYYEQLKTYGDRCIHVIEEIRDYLSGRKAYPSLTKEERRAHIQHLIDLMEEHPEHFQVRLVEHLPLFEYGMKGFNRVIVTAEFYPLHIKLIRYIELKGEQAVVPYLFEFENIWQEASKTQPTNNEVIEILHNLLKETN